MDDSSNTRGASRTDPIGENLILPVCLLVGAFRELRYLIQTITVREGGGVGFWSVFV